MGGEINTIVKLREQCSQTAIEVNREETLTEVKLQIFSQNEEKLFAIYERFSNGCGTIQDADQLSLLKVRQSQFAIDVCFQLLATKSRQRDLDQLSKDCIAEEFRRNMF